MNKIHTARRLLALMIMLAPIYAVAHDNGQIDVKDAWIRAAPPNINVLAAYMVIENHTSSSVKINSIASSHFEKIEIHESSVKDGMAVMQQRQTLSIPSQGSVQLEPGGLHLMLIGRKKPLKPGDKIGLTIEFSTGGKSLVSALVKKGSDDAHEHTHDEHHGAHDTHKQHDHHQQMHP